MEKEQLQQKHTKKKEAKLLPILIGCKTCMLLKLLPFFPLKKKICNTSGEWLIVSKFLDFLLSEWKQMRISVYQKPLTH